MDISKAVEAHKLRLLLPKVEGSVVKLLMMKQIDELLGLAKKSNTTFGYEIRKCVKDYENSKRRFSSIKFDK